MRLQTQETLEILNDLQKLFVNSLETALQMHP